MKRIITPFVLFGLLVISIIFLLFKFSPLRLESWSSFKPTETLSKSQSHEARFSNIISPKAVSTENAASRKPLKRRQKEEASRPPSFQTLDSLNPESPFYFLQSHAIVAPCDRDEHFLENLKGFVAILLKKLNQDAFVFDSDGKSATQAPVVIPLNDSHDLTPFLQELFRALEEEKSVDSIGK